MQQSILKKILFLDIDGVLHPLTSSSLPLHASLTDLVARVDLDLQHGDEEEYMSPTVSGEFMPLNMAHLSRIIKETNAEIVLSSTWRTTNYQYRAAVYQLKCHGVCQGIYECTPQLGMGQSCREQEISLYLQRVTIANPSVEYRYCCIDDAELCWNSSHVSDNEECVFQFNPLCFVRCDSATGITEDDARKVIKILNKC